LFDDDRNSRRGGSGLWGITQCDLALLSLGLNLMEVREDAAQRGALVGPAVMNSRGRRGPCSPICPDRWKDYPTDLGPVPRSPWLACGDVRLIELGCRQQGGHPATAIQHVGRQGLGDVERSPLRRQASEVPDIVWRAAHAELAQCR
jgi:hypothetical protein